jgi:hypothetical protein
LSDSAAVQVEKEFLENALQARLELPVVVASFRVRPSLRPKFSLWFWWQFWWQFV